MSIARIITIAAIAGTSSPGVATLGFDFDFTHESPEYLIVGEQDGKADNALVTSESLELAELEFAGGWTSFTFDAGVGEIDERITGLQVLNASVVGTAGEREEEADLSFVQRMEIYVVGEDGLPFSFSHPTTGMGNFGIRAYCP